jgi:hypothetical protein
MFSEQEILNASILIVDDQEANVLLLGKCCVMSAMFALRRQMIPMKYARFIRKTTTS